MFRHTEGWRFNLCWQNGQGGNARGGGGVGAGGGEGTDGGGGGDAGPGSGGFGGAAANAVASALGQQSPGSTFGTDPSASNSQVSVSFGDEAPSFGQSPTAGGLGGGGPGSTGSAQGGFGKGGGGTTNANDAAAHAAALNTLWGMQHSSQLSNPLSTFGLGQAANINVAPTLAGLAHSSATQGSPSPTLAALAQALFGSTNFGGGIGGQHAAAQANQNAQIAGINAALGGINALGTVRGPGSDATAPTSTYGNMPGPNAFGQTNLGVNTPNVTAAEVFGESQMGDVSTASLAAPFGPPAPSTSINTTNVNPSQTPYGQTETAVTHAVANPNLSPTQKATTVANTLASQTPAQQAQTVQHAINVAQQTMNAGGYEQFLTNLLTAVGHYAPTTGNARTATYAPGP